MLTRPAARHMVQNHLGTLDLLLLAIDQIVHIRRLLLEHLDCPIEREELHMDWHEHIPELVGLDRIALECPLETVILTILACLESQALSEESIERFYPEIVFKTLSDSDSTLRLGTDCSSLHILAAKCDCISDFSFTLSISV